jgi:CRISPR system Cascade subunit CasD
MGKPVLLLRLEGVWQSWGERSRWDVRDTGTEPTKSGVVGLLGCALGYPMRDPRLETELDAGLRFGVRVESPGRVVQDYQTVTDFLPTAEGSYRHSGVATAKSLAKLRNDPQVTPATIISPRYYLEDASFLVALEGQDGFQGLLEKCKLALEDPKWPIFLGRKACVPTRPVLDALTDCYEGLEDALRRHSWSWLWTCADIREKERPEKLVVMIETLDGELQRQDAVRTNQARQYAFRRAHRDTVPTPTGGES